MNEPIHYAPQDFEQKWQDTWLKNKAFQAKDDTSLPKFYCLDMFPFPSGVGLHVGHPIGYLATDILCRKKRHEGINVLHPMGWDAFGLPAENYAIKTGQNPAVITEKNVNNFRKQLRSLGLGYDWDREFSTTNPSYFKWTQWIFLQLHKKGLAYEKTMPMNWCPQCKVVCANEEVEQGKHERCGTEVKKKELKQWMLKITDYAERLLRDIDTLPHWPEKIRAMQKNWIGKSEGAEVVFDVMGNIVEVFTTRPDTLWGATYMVLSPEHPLVNQITTDEYKDSVQAYKEDVQSKSDLERTELNKDKTGVFTGAYAINPVNNEKIPVWIADYVLMSYGTGAIMAVPAHDERDYEFAQKYDLSIRQVIQKQGATLPFADKDGVAIDSDILNGQSFDQAFETVVQMLEAKKLGRKKVNYKLRDWIFTRQRYWGEPIPFVFDINGKLYPIDESQLPVVLPEVEKYEPTETGESPLSAIDDWVNVRGNITSQGTVIICEEGEHEFTRETSTMPNWAGSSWYWLRFMDPDNEQQLCSKEMEQYWGNVDLYVGGAEHAVLHLLYGRFWHKVLYDLGVVSTIEPFESLKNQGLLMGEGGIKMSKSLGNVINPDDVIAKYGVDTFRMYEMFMGPFEQTKEWNESAIQGMRKYAERLWRVLHKPMTDEPADGPMRGLLHKTIKITGEHIDEFKFNTAVSQFMILTNELIGYDTLPREVIETFVVLISPFAPHMAEEIWHEVLGNTSSVMHAPWPQYNETYLVDDMVTYAVQVNGKLRGDFECPKDTSKDDAIAMAKDLDKVSDYLKEGTIVKEIFVPGKIIGFVIK